jgi:radical SAM superfamily enzyme YgiQ (UPF0313 family)
MFLLFFKKYELINFAMKVLLVSANKEMLPDPVAPLGLAYIAAFLMDNDHQVDIVDLCFALDDEKTLANKLKTYMPDIIGISIRNIDNVSFPNSVSYLSFYKDVVSWCRSCSNAHIIVGGSGFTLMPLEILHYLNLDYGIIGEGEERFLEVITELSKNRTNMEVPGLINSKSTPQPEFAPTTFLDFDHIPFPKRDLLDNDAYMKYGGMGNIQTKRGCAFNCIYCTYPLIEGKEVRLRTPKRVVDEIEHMKEVCGIDTFFVVDNVFNYPPDHAQEICKEIIKREIRVRWSCYSNPAFITKELVGLMRDAGCTGIEFGTDSCVNVVLERLRKKFTLEDIRHASSICRKIGMSFCHDILLGAPGENMDTVSETLHIMEEIDPTALIIMIGIRIFPGTELASFAEREGMLSEDKLSLTPQFYISPAVSPFIVEFIKEYAQSHNNCIVPGQNIMNDIRIQKKLRHYGIRGPLWEHMGIRRQRE